MPRAQTLPRSLRGRPFTTAEALALGVSEDRLRSSAVRAPHRGVRVPSDLPDSLEVRCAAAALVLPAAAAFAGRTAMALCGLPAGLGAPDAMDVPLQVTVPPTGAVPRIRGVRAVQSQWADRTVTLPRSGLRVLHPARVWGDVAPTMPLADAVALGDAVRRRWATAETLTEVVRNRQGHRGVEQLRRVLALVRYPVDSAMETLTRLVLVDGGLPEPLCGRNVVVDGGWVACPDLSWPELRVAVEYDGGHHRTDARQWRRDIQRRQLLEAASWRVVVLTADDVLRWPERTVAMVAQVLREQAARR